MSFDDLERIVTLVVLLANMAMFVWYIRLLTRVRLLNRLLGTLCIKAFVHQHAPYWRAWAEIYGYHFEVSVLHRQRTANDDHDNGE